VACQSSSSCHNCNDADYCTGCKRCKRIYMKSDCADIKPSAWDEFIPDADL
jgi:hypothetical protein